jgi:hypothetical protein
MRKQYLAPHGLTPSAQNDSLLLGVADSLDLPKPTECRGQIRAKGPRESPSDD